ncbi:unnamed protein product [Ixodes hexagonus]
MSLLFYLGSSIFTVVVSTIGDKTVAHEYLRNFLWLRAAADNVTHGLIGVICWAAVCGPSLFPASVRESILCGLIASAVDIDHFLAAASLKIEDATSLRSRPFLHCTSIVMVTILTVMLVARLTGQLQLYHLTLMASVAVTSHHLRDSLRRGLWLWPYGSTPPVKIGFYYAGLACVVLMASLGMRNNLQVQEPIVRLV